VEVWTALRWKSRRRKGAANGWKSSARRQKKGRKGGGEGVVVGEENREADQFTDKAGHDRQLS